MSKKVSELSQYSTKSILLNDISIMISHSYVFSMTALTVNNWFCVHMVLIQIEHILNRCFHYQVSLLL